MGCSFSQRKWINKITKLAEKYPSEVGIIHNTDGSIYAKVPLSYLKINHPKVMTDDQKEAAAERMRKARDKK